MRKHIFNMQISTLQVSRLNNLAKALDTTNAQVVRRGLELLEQEQAKKAALSRPNGKISKPQQELLAYLKQKMQKDGYTNEDEFINDIMQLLG